MSWYLKCRYQDWGILLQILSQTVTVLNISYGYQPPFRLFLSLDPSHGEISRAMRNRGIEIFILPEVRIQALFSDNCYSCVPSYIWVEAVKIHFDLHHDIFITWPKPRFTRPLTQIPIRIRVRVDNNPLQNVGTVYMRCSDPNQDCNLGSTHIRRYVCYVTQTTSVQPFSHRSTSSGSCVYT